MFLKILFKKLRQEFCNHRFEESTLECINPYTGKSGIYVICECYKCSFGADHNAGRLAQQWNNEVFYGQYKPQYPGEGHKMIIDLQPFTFEPIIATPALQEIQESPKEIQPPTYKKESKTCDE